jgi:L-gulonate 5-dehydrogenase
MKALVLTDTKVLTYKDAPDPVAGAGEVLVRIAHSGICGSDMHAFLGHDARRPTPLILGHEASGTIEGGPRNGQRVTINPQVSCGTCRDCTSGRTNICATRQIISIPPREGAFAELVVMPETHVIDVPDGVSLRAAALCEPLACGWHGVSLGLAALPESPGEIKALVLGGGAIGVGAALSLAAQGVNQIEVVEPNPVRADRLTAHPEFTTTTQASAPGSYELVIDAVGYAATRATASAAARQGGFIVHIGLGEDTGGLDIRRMTLQEVGFTGTYAYTFQDFRDTAQAIFEGRLGALDWVATRALSDGQSAFDDIRNGRVAAPKIILEP